MFITIKCTFRRPMFLFVSILILMLNACGEDTVDIRTHYDNPFAESKKWYVNQKWAEQARADGGEAIANESSAIWLKRISDIKPYDRQVPRNGMGLREHLDAALEQRADLFTFVMYNLPGKGCSEVYGNITPTETIDFWRYEASQQNMDSYKNEYINSIVNIVSDDKYAGISIVAIIEPDTLIHQTNSFLSPYCVLASNKNPWGYTEGVRYTLEQFRPLKNIHSYIAVGNASILGKEENLRFASMFVKGVLTGFEGLAAQAGALRREFELRNAGGGKFMDIEDVFVEPAGETPPPGWGAINGFISNVASYIPLEEPYLSLSPKLTEGTPQDTIFYNGNPIFGELEYSRKWLKAMRDYGADKSLGMLIDTSRNGWGGSNRPQPQPDTIYASEDERVEALRIDRRYHRRSYCNQNGAGIGERPQAKPKDYIDAYVWIKAVGQSDGISNPNIEVDPNTVSNKTNEMCQPNGRNNFAEDQASTAGKGIVTGAMKNAPHYGQWFSDAFKQLLENANPPIGNDLDANIRDD